MEKICKNCQWRKTAKGYNENQGFCTNPKLTDDIGHDEEFTKDALLYQFNESGGFIVGDFFGCIHFEQKM